MPLYGAGVEYAIPTLLNRARAPAGTAPSARDLADLQRLPVPSVQKLLTQPEKAGLVAGAEGVRGGWRLARGPPAIPVLEFADAPTGGERLFECREVGAPCSLWEDGPPAPAALPAVWRPPA